MKCLKCQEENAENAKFCVKCAQSLSTVIECPECSHVNPAASKFCEDCGKPLVVPTTHHDKKRIIKTACISLVISAPIFIFFFFFWKAIGPSGGAERFPIAWLIIISAVLGAVVNQAFDKQKNQPVFFTWGKLVIFFLWKIAIAIIFAFTLYLIFISGLITSDVFPRFVHDSSPYTNIMDFVTQVDPASFKDVARILVWSFVAGYSELFVPNLVLKMVDSSRLTENEKHAKPNGTE